MPINDAPISDDDAEKFILGGLGENRGTPEGGTVDIDNDEDSEAGERLRVIKPYRWWTWAYGLAGLALVVAWSFGVYANGLADFGSNRVVTSSVPVSATMFSDGVLEVVFEASALESCGRDECSPNQFGVIRNGSTLVFSAYRESPVGGRECSVEGSANISASGSVTVRVSDSEGLTAVSSGDGSVSVPVEESTAVSGDGAGFLEIPVFYGC